MFLCPTECRKLDGFADFAKQAIYRRPNPATISTMRLIAVGQPRRTAPRRRTRSPRNENGEDHATLSMDDCRGPGRGDALPRRGLGQRGQTGVRPRQDVARVKATSTARWTPTPQAARADRENRQYVAQYSLVRQVVELRKRLDAEQDPEQWENMARALRSFYLREGIYREALALDQKVHARLATAATARMLAETQLALDMNGEAAETLASLEPEKATPSTQGLLVVALARQGKTGRRASSRRVGRRAQAARCPSGLHLGVDVRGGGRTGEVAGTCSLGRSRGSRRAFARLQGPREGVPRVRRVAVGRVGQGDGDRVEGARVEVQRRQ